MKFTSLKYAGIFMLWLMHISAFIGINMGYSSFFLPLSSLNLWFIFALLILFYPIKNIKEIILFLGIAITGFLVEVIGVATGDIFGEYAYGENLGLKLAGVPIIIGVNWAILSFVTAEIANTFRVNSIFIKAFISSTLMLIFDFFIEQSAPKFDFWEFQLPEVPLQNYITWFVLAYIFSFAVLKFKPDANPTISFHIYIVQILFFTLFYVF